MPAESSPVAALADGLAPEFLSEYHLLPIDRREGRIVVASAGAPHPQALADLAARLEQPIEVREMGADEFARAMQEHLQGPEATAAGLIAELRDGDAEGSGDGALGDGALDADDLASLANQAPVVRLVNLLLGEALAQRASDVHLEARGMGLCVRYRVDGVLHDAPSPPPAYRAAIVSRLKVMAELDIAERRVPQDGRVRLQVAGRATDVRVSTLPSLHGESVVLRLLEDGGRPLSVHELGMSAPVEEALLRAASRPHGVLLVTGPTGSGKTTTLYALVQRLRTGHEKVVSVEDPVEYELPGVVQVPVQPKAGLTFARALRAILRQDPDTLLVGELRDGETAEICTQAALTGHLVLSTLHTNDAPSALPRLLDLGVADYLVTSTVEAVLAQRLVRRICDGCREPAPLDPLAWRQIEEDGAVVPEAWHGRGCDRCRHTGYRGRTGIYELLVVDDELRRLFLRTPDSGALRRAALAGTMRPLRADGWRQVAGGVTTVDEVRRVTQG